MYHYLYTLHPRLIPILTVLFATIVCIEVVRMKALHRQGKFDKILNHKVVCQYPRFPRRLPSPSTLTRDLHHSRRQWTDRMTFFVHRAVWQEPFLSCWTPNTDLPAPGWGRVNGAALMA